MRHPNLIAPSRLLYEKDLKLKKKKKQKSDTPKNLLLRQNLHGKIVNLKKEAWLLNKDRIVVKEINQAF